MFGLSFGTNGHITKLIVVMASQCCEENKNHWIVHFKWANCITSVCGKPIYPIFSSYFPWIRDLGMTQTESVCSSHLHPLPPYWKNHSLSRVFLLMLSETSSAPSTSSQSTPINSSFLIYLEFGPHRPFLFVKNIKIKKCILLLWVFLQHVGSLIAICGI